MKNALATALIVIVAMVGAFFAGRATIHPEIIETERVERTSIPVRVETVRENVITRVDTIFVDSTRYEIAYYKEAIDTNKVSLDLSVRYDERSNLFTIKHDIVTMLDSVYVENTVIKEVEKKSPLILPCAGLSVGFLEKTLNNASVDAGVLVRGKYQLTAFVDTEKRYGLRLGVVWD